MVALGAALPTAVDDAYIGTIADIQSQGHHTETRPGGRSSIEVLGYQTGMGSPRARLLNNAQRQLNIVGAVARLVWMIAGSDRLADIAYYEPKVLSYTDNRLSVPGSNYGARLFQPRPGVNQLEGAVERLREYPGTRQAAAVIWSPEDAVRASADIPCAFGVFYHIRDGALVATTAMRSNNAYLLLPYNFFEFSLLAEIVAAELGIPLGSYLHWAASMHLLDRETEGIARVVAAGPGVSIEMPNMPSDPGPLSQAYEVARFEAKVRMSTSAQDADRVFDEAGETLHQYWHALLGVLVVHRHVVSEERDRVARIADELPTYLSDPLESYLAQAKVAVGSPASVGGEQLTIIDIPDETGAGLVSAALLLAPDEEKYVLDQLQRICDEIGEELSFPNGTGEYEVLRSEVLRLAQSQVAARSETGPTSSASDRLRVTKDDVKRLITEMRSRK